jgi:ABC-type enterochelin transport system permease subunit
MYLHSVPDSNTPIWLAVILAFSSFVLLLVSIALFKAAEQYEVDRLGRYWKIFIGLKPQAYVFVVGLLGYTSIAMVSPIQDVILKMNVVMFGALLIILSARWWMEDIKHFRLPKSDTL